MQLAREGGAKQVVDGLGMLIEQAAESFLLWRGVRPDTAPVYRELRELLSRAVLLGAADSTTAVR
jgi:shikimate dehydrogenase